MNLFRQFRSSQIVRVFTVAVGGLVASGLPARGQSLSGWTGNGSSAAWSDALSWTGGVPTTGVSDLYFGQAFRAAGGSGFVTSTNDLNSFVGYRITFEDSDAAGNGADGSAANDTSFLIAGNGFTLTSSESSTPPMVRNNSFVDQTFNLSGTLTFQGYNSMGGFAVVDAAKGNIVINNAVDLASRTDLFVTGASGRTVAFNGPITGSGSALNSVRIGVVNDPQSVTAIITGTGNSYGGGTFVNVGTLQLGSIVGVTPVNGAVAGTIYLGDQNSHYQQDTTTSRLVLAGTGGQTFPNPIQSTIGWSGGERIIAGQFNDTATMTGTISMIGDLTIAAAAGSTLEVRRINSNYGTLNIGSQTTSNGGTIILSGNTDNTGFNARVQSGTLLLAKDSSASVHAIPSGVGAHTGGTVMLGGTGGDQISDSASMFLDGGTFNTAGLSERSGTTTVTPGIGALTLFQTSIIDLSHGASVIAFANSSGMGWTSDATLKIYNWTGGGIDQLYFASDFGLGLTSQQLTQISFFSDSGSTFLGTAGWAEGTTGEVVPIPEPGTWAAGALLMCGCAWTKRRRVKDKARRLGLPGRSGPA